MKTISIRLENIGDIDYFGKLLRETRSDLVRSLVDEGRKMKISNVIKLKWLASINSREWNFKKREIYLKLNETN